MLMPLLFVDMLMLRVERLWPLLCQRTNCRSVAAVCSHVPDRAHSFNRNLDLFSLCIMKFWLLRIYDTMVRSIPDCVTLRGRCKVAPLKWHGWDVLYVHTGGIIVGCEVVGQSLVPR